MRDEIGFDAAIERHVHSPTAWLFHILYASAVALTDRFPSLSTAISIPLWSILGRYSRASRNGIYFLTRSLRGPRALKRMQQLLDICRWQGAVDSIFARHLALRPVRGAGQYNWQPQLTPKAFFARGDLPKKAWR